VDKPSSLLNKPIVLAVVLLFTIITINSSIAVDNLNIEQTNGKSLAVETDWWPMYRHDPQHSGFSTSNAPITNNVLWNYTIGDNICSSPSVVYGRVYITLFGNKLYCLNAKTGDYIWHNDTESYFDWRCSPSVADNKVYFNLVNGDVYCLDANDGDYIWKYSTDDQVRSSPMVKDGKVYIASFDGNVYCLDANTGSYIWSYQAGDLVFSTPTVADDKVYIASYNGDVYCLKANTGSYLWSIETGDVYSTPAVEDGRVYFGSNDYYMYCLDGDSGDIIWRNKIGGHYHSSPAIAYGKIYISRWGVCLHCLNASNGDTIWEYWATNALGDPAVADGKVYIGSTTGNTIYCFDANNGDHIWSFEKENMSWFSSPAVANGKVYLGSTRGIIYAFGPEIEIDSIKGGLFRVTMVLYNRRNVPVNVKWSILLNGSVWIGEESTGTLTINAGEKETVKSNLILGLGKIRVIASAEIGDGQSDIKIKDGFVFLFFSHLKSSN
jgi:outer membrane protein assembly factor BamB